MLTFTNINIDIMDKNCLIAPMNYKGTLKEHSVQPLPCTSANEVPVCHAVTCTMDGVRALPC
jgi:hypothetical protein